MLRFSVRDLLVITVVAAVAVRISLFFAEPLAFVANSLQNEAIAMDTSEIEPE